MLYKYCSQLSSEREGEKLYYSIFATALWNYPAVLHVQQDILLIQPVFFIYYNRMDQTDE